MSSTSCSCLLKGLDRRITAEMITFMNTPLMEQISSNIILILCITLINGLLLFITVAQIIRRMKQTSAKYKHFIWLFLLYCFIAIPILSIFIPSFDMDIVNIPVVEALAIEKHTALTEVDARLSAASQSLEENLDTTSQLAVSVSDTVRPITMIRWQTVATLIWIAGAILSMFRIIVGRIGLCCMTKKSVPVDSIPFSSLVETLCKRLGIRQKVQVRKSSQCITPFTCYLFQSVILLPANTAGWSEDRLRIVLLHELAHIRRRDHVSRFIARLLCALLWFIPPVWIAYNRLQVEEEKACDASVIATGVKASDYAGHIIDIARSTRGKVLSLMFQHSFGRRSTLEPRIRNILRLKGNSEQVGVGVLIRVLVICFVCLLALHVVNPVSARENRGLFKKEAPVDLLYGRWVNTRGYEHWECASRARKVVIDRDGSVHVYKTPTSLEHSYLGHNGHYTIVESRMDRKGYCWYKVITEYPYVSWTWHDLWRIDPSGSTLEMMAYSYAEHPVEIDPQSVSYYTFDRN